MSWLRRARDGRNFSRTVCQDLSVLISVPKEGILSSSSHGQGNSDSVTLVASPDQVEKLSVAKAIGKLCLVLRNPGDHSIAALAGSDEHDVLPGIAFPNKQPEIKPLLSLQPPLAPPQMQPLPPAPAAPVKLGWLIELYKGATKNELVFGNGGQPGETVMPGGPSEIGSNERESGSQRPPTLTGDAVGLHRQPTLAGDAVVPQPHDPGSLSW